MGSNFSCLDAYHPSYTLENTILKTNTDGEMTEFLANSGFLLEEYDKIIKSRIKPEIKITPRKMSSYETESTPKFVSSLSSSPVLRKCKNSNYPHRIFSSNVKQRSVNIINAIQSSRSICSTNVNSRSTSRCVSPLAKLKS
jgi:hypothetical protein